MIFSWICLWVFLSLDLVCCWRRHWRRVVTLGFMMEWLGLLDRICCWWNSDFSIIRLECELGWPISRHFGIWLGWRKMWAYSCTAILSPDSDFWPFIISSDELFPFCPISVDFERWWLIISCWNRFAWLTWYLSQPINSFESSVRSSHSFFENHLKTYQFFVSSSVPVLFAHFSTFSGHVLKWSIMISKIWWFLLRYCCLPRLSSAPARTSPSPLFSIVSRLSTAALILMCRWPHGWTCTCFGALDSQLPTSWHLLSAPPAQPYAFTAYCWVW